MSPAFARWLVIGALLVLISVAVVLLSRMNGEESAPVEGVSSAVDVVAGKGWDVSLYVPDTGGALTAMSLTLDVPVVGTGVSAQVAQSKAGLALVGALLKAEGESLLPAVPGEITVQNFDFGEGVAYVDLVGAPLQLGTHGELLSVYSIVNTVAMNVPGVESVVLLWNGAQRETFAGHIDTTHSLKPRPQLVRDE